MFNYLDIEKMVVEINEKRIKHYTFIYNKLSFCQNISIFSDIMRDYFIVKIEYHNESYNIILDRHEFYDFNILSERIELFENIIKEVKK